MKAKSKTTTKKTSLKGGITPTPRGNEHTFEKVWASIQAMEKAFQKQREEAKSMREETKSMMDKYGFSTGLFAETSFFSAFEHAKDNIRIGGEKVHLYTTSFVVRRKTEKEVITEAEIDTIFRGKNTLLLVEVKFSVSGKREHIANYKKELEKKLNALKTYDPDIIGKRKNIYFAIATTGIKKETVKALQEAGLIVFLIKNERLTIYHPSPLAYV